MVRSGDTVAGRYQVIARIAEGGMGVLWRARHTELDVEVALKVMSPRAATAGALKRFKREAQAVARLRSPHIVHVLDFGVFEDEPYLVLELLRGEDLAALLAREGRLPLERAEQILSGVCKALELAHDADIVHRDLKPANIFLERVGSDEVVKVLDFGVARDLRAAPDPASTTQGTGLGSPAYMSPEQVWGEAAGRPSDVWAMGVVLYEMLAGKNPFSDQTLAGTFERIVREELPAVTAMNPDLPASLDGFFARALARSAAERFQTASEFLTAFRVAASGKPLDSPASVAREPNALGARARQRQRQRMSLVAVALVLIVAAGGLLLAGRRSTESFGSAVSSKAHEGERAPALRTTATAVAASPENAAKSGAPPIELVTAEVHASAKPALRAPASVTTAHSLRRDPRTFPAPSGATANATATATAPAPELDPRFGIPLDK
jgi:serine/threonine protein kinase